MKFKKKPVVIEAFRYGIDCRPDWFMDQVSADAIRTQDKCCDIATLEGVMRGEYGDYIIQGVKGEIYPCKPDIFAMSYEDATTPHPDTLKLSECEARLFALVKAARRLIDVYETLDRDNWVGAIEALKDECGRKV